MSPTGVTEESFHPENFPLVLGNIRLVSVWEKKYFDDLYFKKCYPLSQTQRNKCFKMPTTVLVIF